MAYGALLMAIGFWRKSAFFPLAGFVPDRGHHRESVYL